MLVRLSYTPIIRLSNRGVSRMSAQYNKLHDSLALRADRIVASSQHYASQHRSRYGPLVRAIPWGVDVRSSPPSRVLGASDKLNVLFVGQMRPYKGVETLLAAVAGQPWLQLTLVGCGSELDSYRRLAKRLSATNVRFLGRLPDAELQEQYQLNDVVVLPSVTRAEAFGLVLLEGMAAGCVPVASDLPGVRDVAGPTGLLVSPGNPGALRGALRELACDIPPPGRASGSVMARRAGPQLGTLRRLLEEVLLDAVRSRYARLHGLAILPEVDQRGRPQILGHLQQGISGVPVTAGEH